MTLENAVKNMKGRIREAVYKGKEISILDNWHSFVLRRAGVIIYSTYYFICNESPTRLYVYCRPNIPTDKFLQTVRELKKCIQESGGSFV